MIRALFRRNLRHHAVLFVSLWAGLGLLELLIVRIGAQIETGPGIRANYRRSAPTNITSVAPTLATALGVPTPEDADGAVLWDFFD